MSTDYCLVFCSCPDADTARALAETLVGERLAACVNCLPGLHSVYGWDGRVESASEHMLLIKTLADGYDALEVRLRALHPYDVPEIVAVPMARGSQPYLDWIGAWVGPAAP